MMEGEGDVVAGWPNKLRSAIANVTPRFDTCRPDAFCLRWHVSRADPAPVRALVAAPVEAPKEDPAPPKKFEVLSEASNAAYATPRPLRTPTPPR